jgi:hypothetical protein
LEINALEFAQCEISEMEIEMARPSSIESMSYAELAQMQARIERLKIEKQNAERTELRQRILAMIKQRQRQCSGQVPRPAEPGEHLDRPRAYAPVDGFGDQRREGEEGRFLGLKNCHEVLERRGVEGGHRLGWFFGNRCGASG